MFSITLISFREFLEAFLIIGVFLGISKKLKLKRELEIGFAAGVGIVISLALAIATYFFSKHLLVVFIGKNREIFESCLLIFSGLFITYTIFSLHNILHNIQAKIADKAKKKLQGEVFDVSLFFTIIFLVVREGFEIALFTASTSLLSVFIQNFAGLMIGFVLSVIFGVLIYFTYLKFPINKIFKITEYVIILLGIFMTGSGVIQLFGIIK